MEVLKKGTVEPLLLALRDRLENIASLASVADLRFSVSDKEDDSEVQPDTTVTVDVDFPMTAICQVDTTLVGYVANHEYKLYLKFTEGTSAVKKGPFYFRVEDD